MLCNVYWAHRSDESHGIKPNPARRAKTLVVLPTVAIRQWQAELFRFTRPGSLSVHVYHGTNRGVESSLHTLMEADVVLTSFKIIELEYRRATAGTKVECSICGKKYYPEKLRSHRKYFCGESAQLTEAQSKTQRKKTRVGAGVGGAETVSSSSDDEDEVDRQKRMIKKMRTGGKGSGKDGEKVKGAAAQTKRGKGTAKGKGKGKSLAEPESEDSEDEIDKQKRLIKEMREAKSAAEKARKASVTKKGGVGVAKGQRQEKGKGQTNAAVAVELACDSADDDDDGASKRKIPAKRARGGAGPKTMTPTPPLNGRERRQAAKSFSDDDVTSNRRSGKGGKQQRTQKQNNGKKGAGGGRTGGKRKAVDDGSEDWDSDYMLSSEDSTGQDSDDAESVKKLGAGRGIRRSSHQASSRGSDEENSDESDVEAAIAEALQANKHRAVPSLLHELSWFRVILDEAHLIKDRSTSTAKAAFNLVSLHKWCLTGTPLQNRVGELYSLVRFLRLDPFAYYYCRAKNCDCKSLHYVSSPTSKRI